MDTPHDPEAPHPLEAEPFEPTQELSPAVDNLLIDHQAYESDTPLYTYVTGRLAYLCEGEVDPPPQLLVVHDEPGELTGMATPGYIAVGDGILSRLEYEEEVDAFLTHELTHLVRKHSDMTREAPNLISRIGLKRGHELEADSLPIRWLDKKDINPLGIVSMINKLEAVVDEQAAAAEAADPRPARLRKRDPYIGDTVHGSLPDRRVTIEEVFRLADAAHLSHTNLTPVPLTPEHFTHYTADEAIADDPAAYSAEHQRYFLLRQRQRLASQQPAVVSRPRLERMERQYLEALAPELTPTQHNLAALLLSAQCEPERRQQPSPNPPPPRLTITTQHALGELIAAFPPDSLTQELSGTLLHPAIQEMYVAGSLTPTTLVISELCTAVIQRDGVPEADSFVRLVQAVRDTEFAYTSNYMVDTAVSALAAQPEHPQYAGYVNILSRDPRYTPHFGVTKSEQSRYFQFCDRIDAARTRQIADLKDPFDCAEYCARFGYSVISPEQTSESRYRPQTTSPAATQLDRLVNRISPKVFMTRLIERHQNEPVSPRALALIWRHLTQDQAESDISQQRADAFKGVPFETAAFLTGLSSQEDKGGALQLLDAQRVAHRRGHAPQRAQDVLGRMQYLLELPQRYETHHITPSWQFGAEDLGALGKWQIEGFLMMPELAAKGNWELMYNVLQHLPLPSLTDVQAHLRTTHADDLWQNVVDRLVDVPEERLAAHKKLELLALFSSIAADLPTRLDMPGRLMQLAAQHLPYTEAIDLVRNRYPHFSRQHFTAAIMDLSEEGARTPAELDYLGDQLVSQLEELRKQAASALGMGAIVDTQLLPNYGNQPKGERRVGIRRDLIPSLEPYALLVAMLSSVRDDTDLRRYLLNRWWLQMRTGIMVGKSGSSSDEEVVGMFNVGLREAFGIEDITWLRGEHKAARREDWITKVPRHMQGYVTFDEFVEGMYGSGPALKYYALRKLLLDEQYGVLHQEADTQALIDKFLEVWLDNSDDEAGRFVRQSLQSLVEVTDPELLYQHLYPLLMDIILRPPKQPAGSSDMAHELAARYFDDLQATGDLGSLQRGTPEGDEIFQAMLHKLQGLLSGIPMPSPRQAANITAAVETRYDARILHAVGTETDALRQQIKKEVAQEIAQVQAELMQRLGQKATVAHHTLHEHFPLQVSAEDQRERLSALDLLFILGERTGALGTRMLQLGGMYFDMPDDQREKFSHVYDNMRGQTRLQAWQTLKREAEHSPAIADLVDNLVTFGPRIGGGSLMTVYEAHLRDGSVEAVAVKNPNIEYQLTKLVDTLDATLASLEEKHADETRLSLVRSILTDVTEWILAELADPDFEAKDAALRDRHQDYQAANNRLRILVPRSHPTGTRWVRRDQFIAGRNLTGLTPADRPTNIAEGHINHADYRSAISLLVHNYVHQMQDGLVHSDVHPGNFRVTDDAAHLAVFDRYNLLVFDEHERAALKDIVKHTAVGNLPAVMDALTAHLLSLPENGAASVDRAALADSIARTTQQNTDIAELGPRLLLTLRQHGVHIPLKYTLVTKNLLALQRMSKQAGFGSLAEAYLASASADDLGNLLA